LVKGFEALLSNMAYNKQTRLVEGKLMRKVLKGLAKNAELYR
jgi:hypothetical protein